MSKWLLVLAALLGWGVTHVAPHKQDYIGMVAAEVAYAALISTQAPVAPAPVNPENCPTCGGTGKVKTGDGQGWTKCPTCKPSSQATPTTKPTLPLTAPPSPANGFPARSPSSSLPSNKTCPDGNCPLRAYPTSHS